MSSSARGRLLSLLAVLLLLGGASSAFAAPNAHLQARGFTPTISRSLSATEVGGVINLGTQIYSVSWGSVAFATIGGQVVDPTTASISYSFRATQEGVDSQGTASLNFSGMTAGGPVSFSGAFAINGSVPASMLPTGCTDSCQSELPFMFLTSTSAATMTTAGAARTVVETLQIESPYFNPWGAPLILATPDGAVVIAATYTHGNIIWMGTQEGGQISGTLGVDAVSGDFSMTSNEVENLVSGTSIDGGTIFYSSMTPSYLDGPGFFYGTSTIPVAGSYDCSANTGIPGTCTETGFQSTGYFQTAALAGNYTSTWGVPALGFSSSVSASWNQLSAAPGSWKAPLCPTSSILHFLLENSCYF
jgi:hypothetical protein